MALTFVVPYGVAAYGAVSLALSRARSPRRQGAAEPRLTFNRRTFT